MQEDLEDWDLSTKSILIKELKHSKILEIYVENVILTFRNCESRRPLIFEYIKADRASRVDVWMENFGDKFTLRRLKKRRWLL